MEGSTAQEKFEPLSAAHFNVGVLLERILLH